MKVSIDREDCISCELCVETCPSVFRMAEDGLAEVYGPVDAANEAAATEAAENCPVSIIHLD